MTPPTPAQTCQAPGTTPHLVDGAASWGGGQAVLQVPTGLLTDGQASWARFCFPAAQHSPGSLEGVQSCPGQGSPVGARAEDRWSDRAQALSKLPLSWFWLHKTPAAQSKGWGAALCWGWGWLAGRIRPGLTQTPAGHGAGAPPPGIAARLPPHRVAASGSPQLSGRPTTWPQGLCLQGAGVGGGAP